MLKNEAHECFIREFIKDWNCVRSYRVAYPKAGISAISNAYLLLKREEVKKRMNELLEDDERFLNISKRLIAQKHIDIINCNVTNFHTDWITRKEFDQIPDADRGCIQEIITEKRPIADGNGHVEWTEYIKIKLYDKQKSLDALTKLFGYNAPEVKHVKKAVIKTYVIKPAGDRIAS